MVLAHSVTRRTRSGAAQAAAAARSPGERGRCWRHGRALIILAEAGPAFAGLNLGNHNESLLTPPDAPPTPQRTGPGRRLAVSALTLAAGLAVTAGFVNDGTSNTRHEAIPGNYTSSSGGGGRTYR